MKKLGNRWWPEICYFEPGVVDDQTSIFPFINVPQGEEMPRVLFIMEKKDSGDFEPGLDGTDQPISELNMKAYYDIEYLKNKIEDETYKKIKEIFRG